jgi:hypothetical protein
MYGSIPVHLRYSVLQSVSRSIDRLIHKKLIRSRLRVVWTALDGTETVVADTEEGYRVLETTSVSLTWRGYD